MSYRLRGYSDVGMFHGLSLVVYNYCSLYHLWFITVLQFTNRPKLLL